MRDTETLRPFKNINEAYDFLEGAVHTDYRPTFEGKDVRRVIVVTEGKIPTSVCFHYIDKGFCAITFNLRRKR